MAATYGGNPLAMAAASAVLDAVANDEFLAHVRDMGAKLTAVWSSSSAIIPICSNWCAGAACCWG
jgi:acetylornithine/succinyldiaminopimelate/putrescine aminotransferase